MEICHSAFGGRSSQCKIAVVFGYERIEVPFGVMAVTRPPVVDRIARQPRPDRIELDVSLADEEVSLAIDGRRPEATFPESAAALAAVIDCAHVSAADPLHHARHGVCLVRGHQQMNVIGHQYVRVHRAAVLGGCSAQAIEVEPMVVVREEARCTVVPALDDMQRNAWQL